uniref:Enoyl reductase (ER) domain-containing protein n=1 Tax=Romanomermis culicivorax TaxID=13658 RepID=A0A915KYI3_ROMCU
MNLTPFRISRRFYRSAILKEFGKPLEIATDSKEPHISQKEVGFELAGEIESVGKAVKNFNVGDRVLALKTVSTGAFAEKCAELYKIPHSLSYEMAASLPTAYGSAYFALNDAAKATEGETVLVVTSQGASGIATIDLAANVFRCKVIVASDSEEKLEMVRPDGVLATVTYTNKNMVNHVLKSVKDGVDIIVDTVGGKWFSEALKCIKPGGRIISLSFTSGEAPLVDVQSLIKYNASVCG